MRTTLSIDDHLLTAAKRRARERGVSLGHVVDDALRRELAAPPAETPIEVPVFAGEGGLSAGVDATSNRALYETLDAERPPEALR